MQDHYPSSLRLSQMNSIFSLDLTRADGRRSLNLIGVLFETVLGLFSLLTQVRAPNR